MVKDPVCGMYINEKAALKSDYGHKTFYFCSHNCKAAFDKNPAHFAK